MPTYYDGYDGYDSYEHSIYVKLIDAGFDTDDANLMARIKVAKDRDKSLIQMVKERGVRGLLDYARSHWPTLCNWVENVWDKVKSWFGY